MTRLIILTAFCFGLAGAASAQGTDVAFGGIKADPTLPVEVTSDSLSVDQTDGSAVFSGNVIVAQGAMKLSAAEVRVAYSKGTDRRIEQMTASGGVTLVSGAEAAQSQHAVYTPDTGVVVMSGEVVLTQGQNAMSGQALTVDLTTGKGRMEGRVKTILAPAKKN